MFIVSTVCACAGCVAGRGGTVRIDQQGGRSLAKSFPQAYVTSGRGGEYDIVLLDESLPDQTTNPLAFFQPQSRARPLEPLALPPLRQVMHIHLYWKPLLGTTKNPAATNAFIRWYVLGPDGESVLVYEGAGYVSLRGGGRKRLVIINEATIHCNAAASRGNLADPIGRAMLTGTVVARVNETTTGETLTELKNLVAAAGK